MNSGRRHTKRMTQNCGHALAIRPDAILAGKLIPPHNIPSSRPPHLCSVCNADITPSSGLDAGSLQSPNPIALAHSAASCSLARSLSLSLHPSPSCSGLSPFTSSHRHFLASPSFAVTRDLNSSYSTSTDVSEIGAGSVTSDSGNSDSARSDSEVFEWTSASWSALASPSQFRARHNAKIVPLIPRAAAPPPDATMAQLCVDSCTLS